MIDEDGTTVLEAPPAEKKLKMSECTPLFMNAYKIANAGACVHSHSQNAVMATLLCGSEFLFGFLAQSPLSFEEMLEGSKVLRHGSMPRLEEWL